MKEENPLKEENTKRAVEGAVLHAVRARLAQVVFPLLREYAAAMAAYAELGQQCTKLRYKGWTETTRGRARYLERGSIKLGFDKASGIYFGYSDISRLTEELPGLLDELVKEIQGMKSRNQELTESVRLHAGGVLTSFLDSMKGR